MPSAMKRFLSLLLVVVMVFSMVPGQVLADEIDNYNGDLLTEQWGEELETPVDPLYEGDRLNGEYTQVEEQIQTGEIWPEEEVVQQPAEASATAIDLVNRINAVLYLYGITADMTDDQIGTAICAQPWSVNKPTISEIAQIEEMAEMAPESDAAYVLANADVVTFVRFKDIFKPMFAIAMAAASGNHKPVEGVSVGVSGATDNSMSSGSITVTAKGSGGILGFGASAKTATITVANDSGSKAKLSFNWTATSVNQLKIDGTQYTGGSGSFEKIMDSGTSFTITITTAKNSTVNKLVMNNFAIVAVKESSNVTFLYDSALGSVTAAGEAVSDGELLEVSMEGTELVATANSGATLLGWIDGTTHKILSKDAAYTLTPADDMTVQAVFASTSPWFLVNGDCLYEGLNAAVEAVQSVSNKIIVLANNGTLPAGDYTIPAGVTLLLPFDAANTLCTTAPVCRKLVEDPREYYKVPTAYRTLTMETGANLCIEGAMSLSGTQLSGGTNAGVPLDAVPFVKMEEGSTITVASGANLYVWGYIIGSGSVVVKNGGTVYEDFQVTNWRGGTNTSNMVDNDNRVFPMSQYYIQNVEVPMTLEAGAVENGYMSVAISVIGIQSSAVPFVGPNGMFNITAGSITKDYIESEDRLEININGNLTMQSLSISMKLGLLGTKTINSSKYELPVNSNITVRVNSGSNMTVTQNIAMLPGTQMYVADGANITLGNGIKLYLYDADEWVGKGYPQPQKDVCPLPYAPGKPASVAWHTADEDAYVYVEGTLDASNGYVYTTAGGANITAAEGAKVILKPGIQTTTSQAYQTGTDGKTIEYDAIPITPAKLKNADGGYTETAALPYAEYAYTNGTWVGNCLHVITEAVTAQATCTVDGVKTFSCKCGHNYTEAIPATGHKTVTDAAVAPTCTQTGLTEGSHCETCGEVFVAQEEIPANGHGEGVPGGDAVAPTCTAEGWTESTLCSVCGATIVPRAAIPALGHTAGGEATCTTAQTCVTCGAELVAALGHKPGAEATCTADQVCTVCGDVLVAAKGHTPEDVPAKAPTCEDYGLTAGVKCTTCGVMTTVQAVLDPLGHTPGAEATCTVDQTCTVCGKTLVAAKGHIGVVDDAVKPTCTTTGLTQGTHCDICGETLIAQEEVPALGHSWDNGVVTTEPTEEATGVKTYTCGTCGDTKTEEIPRLDHVHKHNAVVTAPTCTAEGYTTYTCRCGDTYTADAVAALGHSSVTDAAVAPTCTETGLTEGSHCGTCGEVLAAQEEVAAAGHTPGAEATCTTAQECMVCGAELVAAKGHNGVPGGDAVAPTCTAEGWTESTVCSVCGVTLVAREAIAALGHTAGAEATCTEAQVCTVCDAELVAALGHSSVTDAAVAPTCTETGLTEGSHCETCGEVLVAQEEVAASGHTAGEEATCTEAQVCTICGAELATALGHKTVTDAAVAPTCTETGLTEGSHCETCGEVFAAQEEVAALGHTAGAEATCTTAQVCTVCGAELVAALGHGELEYEEELPPLCEEDGHEEGLKCTVCGEFAEGGAVKEATGHNLEQFEEKIPTYTRPGYAAFEKCTQCAYTTYEEIKQLEVPHISDYETFITNLYVLEMAAGEYVADRPRLDPLDLVIKYIRTGVERYNSGSWNIMAGYEDADFRKFIEDYEDAWNCEQGEDNKENWMALSALKYLDEFTLPNGDLVDFGHMFGTMDITYHNNCGVDHADVGGWSGDLVDLLTTTSNHIGENYTSDLETLVAFIKENYLFKMVNTDDKFSATDWYGDADGFYVMQNLNKATYQAGDMAMLMQSYFTEELNDVDRADYLVINRFGGLSTRQDLRTAVYNAYTGNKTISTLEATRDFNHSGTELTLMRKAVCYAFADYLCQTAGDYVDVIENPYYEVFDSKSAELAPGITQQLNFATSADGKQMAYYIATADLRNPQVHVYANYASRDPQHWEMARVLDQANTMQALYGDPASEEYVENFNVIASINAGGFDMSDGDPGGLLVMHGQTYKPIGSGGFFAITKEGKAILGATSEWDQYKDQVEEAIGGFGTLLVKDGEIAITANSNYYNDRAPRSAVGITATGKVVFMVLDGRQEPISCGGSMIEIAQIMFEAGCVNAINLDGGGSSTFVAKQPGDETLSIMNRPSDGTPRSVSTSLVMASTAPSSTAFDHANLVSATSQVTKGTSLQITAEGISATGNAAELPEGTTWEIDSDYANWAAIDENGLFTAKDRLGDVEVKLMLDGTIVGRTTISIVDPDQIYFEKAALSAVFGQTIQLPVKVLYEGKEVTVRPEDIAFQMNAAAGTISGFEFTAKEGNVKNVRITATLVNNTEAAPANVTVNLYKQGENSFDFDQATAGDRTLAWLRTVSNSTTDDDVTYTVLDPDKDMVTSYVLAMDMSQIPVPPVLEDLIYMLPGADLEDASAWGFLMQLAERVSPMTTVTPKIVFDKNVDVDLSEMKLLNDYFTITDYVFDETTNTLSLVLNWIDQTKAIDPATANPLCMVTGIKVTPKADADWGSKEMLNIVHEGDISYDIYLRASGLYSFASKPENQQTFGLYSYTNPDDAKDRGGHFMSTYAQFKDTYTLVRTAKEGWVNEAGGFAYYVDGQRLTGVQEIEGVLYDFGENGINVGQNKFTGLFYDEEAKVYRYSYIGVLTSGWQMIEKEWYYFDSATMAAATGKRTISHVPYEFEENGRLVSGVWMNVFVGYRYYYGPDYVRKGWYEIDGEMYYFLDAFAVSGDKKVASQEISTTKRWYHFGEKGACEGLLTGIVENNGKLYYVENGKETEKGLFKFGDYHYNAQYDGSLIVNQKYYVWKLDPTAELPKGHYEFDEQGRLLGAEVSEDGGVSGIVEKDGVLYYYENGKPTEKGLFKYNGYYYNAQYDGSLITNQKYYVWKLDATAELPKGHYEFGADGRMLQGIIDKDGVLYYYENGAPKEMGLFKYEDSYYVAQYDGSLIVNQKYYVWKLDASADLPKAHYEFGPDGKMYHGIVEKDGVLYYYENGVGVEKGLFLYEDGCHYFAQTGGELITSQKYYAWKLDSSALLDKGHYEFAEDGKLVGSCITGEIVNKNGVLYYYENGKPTEKGLFKFNGDYYVAQYDGMVITGKYYVWKHDITSDLPNGHYEFGNDGKMLQGIVDKDGVLYYYENGKPTEKGLFKYNGDYYVAQYDGSVITGKYYVWKLDETADLPKAHYEFGADGKMLQGIINKDGVLYYYENGKPTEKGLFVLDGDYYFSQYDGKLITGMKYYAWKLHETSELEKGTYLFDENGKLLGAKKTGEIVNVDGVLYYYESGKPVDKGLFILDGYYYFTLYDGSLVVNQRYYVWRDNDYLMVKHYTFNELGQIIE